MGSLLSLGLSLLSNWQRIVIYAVVAAALAATVWMHGYFKGKTALYEYQAKQAQEATRIAGVRREVTVRVETKWRNTDRVIEKQGETIIKEVPVYVTAKDDAACGPVPAGFVRLWNDSNRGVVPEQARDLR